MRIKKIILYIFNQLKVLNRIGFLKYFLYIISRRGKKIKVIIAEEEILIRKGTPDLDVAITCLHGEYEILKFLFPSDFNGIIIDAGGYIGTSAIALRKLFPHARIIVIEPSIENLAVLKQNLSNVANIEIVYGALVGTQEEKVSLNDRGTGEWGFTVVNKPGDNIHALSLHETPAFRLNDLLNDGERISLLKLDIEGGEYSILQNDMEVLKEIPVVFAELHDRIVPGCKEKYFEFSKDRILLKDQDEKYLSIKR